MPSSATSTPSSLAPNPPPRHPNLTRNDLAGGGPPRRPHRQRFCPTPPPLKPLPVRFRWRGGGSKLADVNISSPSPRSRALWVRFRWRGTGRKGLRVRLRRRGGGHKERSRRGASPERESGAARLGIRRANEKPRSARLRGPSEAEASRSGRELALCQAAGSSVDAASDSAGISLSGSTGSPVSGSTSTAPRLRREYSPSNSSCRYIS